ncbi:MAG: bifunctional lysine ketoglutarate reductase /saccharopine dehydrogenase family protein [Candidatus Aminicenantales bacterium]
MSSFTIGIRREDINKWERRVPLIPSHVRELIKSRGIEIYVQPSAIRIFPDADYAAEGARVQENICPSRVVFAIKEIPLESLEKDKTYIFFSHTAKGQPHNMPMLRKMMDLGCSLIDYERIVDERGRRILFFGGFAGQAGMIDTLWALGRRLELEGVKTPFLGLDQTWRYASLVDAVEKVAATAREIDQKGLPDRLRPLACGFLGYGHVSRGAQDVFDHLPCDEVRPADLPGLFEKTPKARGLYKVVFKEEDMVRPIERGRAFDLQDFYDHPEKYESIVERSIPYLTLLVNGIFWTPRFPKYLTRKFLRGLYAGKTAPRLKVIGDITCDINGSLESTVKATDSENPCYVYDPANDRALTGFEGRGPVVMAVYNLPAELPLESSSYFSGGLKEYVPAIASADYRGEFGACGLPPEIRRAVILYRGRLTPAYSYLAPSIG